MIQWQLGLLVVGGRRLEHLAYIANDPFMQRVGNSGRCRPRARWSLAQAVQTKTIEHDRKALRGFLREPCGRRWVPRCADAFFREMC